MEAPPVLPPPPALPVADIQKIKDTEHLRLLGIGYYIVGGFTALFSCLGIIHVVFGLLMLGGAFPPGIPPRHHYAGPARPPGEAAPGEAVANPPAPRPSMAPFSPDRQDAEPPAPPRPDRPFSPDHPEPRWHRDQVMPPFFGLMMLGIRGLVVLGGWTVGGLSLYAGYCLQRRRHRVFTLIVAGVNCLYVPFGTALGVFTFIVLDRPAVKALYLPPGAGQP